MDILPEPRDSLPDVQCPLASPIISYHGRDLVSFGKKLTRKFGSPESMTPESRAAFIQSWLFFGLLSRLLSDDFHMEDFISQPTSTSCSFLSLAKLPVLMKGRAQNDDMGKLVKFAADEVYQWDLKGYLDQSPAGESGLVVHLLARSVHAIFRNSRNREIWDWKWSSKFLESYMKSQGWCPQQIEWVMRFCDASTACYLARLRRPSLVSHENCNSEACIANDVSLDSTYQQRHVTEGCTCETLHVNAAEIKKIIRQGGIPLVSVQKGDHGRVDLKVHRAASKSQYTSISHVWSDGLGNPAANAIPQCQAEMISNTLSSVSYKRQWHDRPSDFGVRIEQDNETPATSHWPTFKHDSPPLFWLDTLCIPVASSSASDDEKAEVDELKMLAINQMSLIYAMAFQVFVLDSELRLEGDVLDETAQIEFLARLVCSPWMRRCWTLQEGALARKIILTSKFGPLRPYTTIYGDRSFLDLTEAPGMFFQGWILKLFRFLRQLGSSVDATSISDHFAMRQSKPIHDHVCTRLQYILSDVIRTYDRSRSLGQATSEAQLSQFCTVWNHLAYRNTTQKRDLPAIFANLLDMNAWKVLQYPASQRMEVLLRSLEYLPVDLLFNHGPRAFPSQDCQKRWIPKWPSQTRMHDTLSGQKGSNVLNSILKWDEQGSLKLSLANNKQFSMVQLEGCNMRDQSCPSFIIQFKDQEGLKTLSLKIQLDYPLEDELQRNDKRMEVLIFQKRDHHTHGTSLGCLLQVTETIPRANYFICLYDCPFTCTAATPEELTDASIASCVVISQPTTILIPSTEDGPRLPKNSQRILLDKSFFVSKYITMLSVLLIGLLFHGISVIIRIVIEVRLGWSHLNAVGKAATILFTLEATWIFFLIIPPPLAQVLFIISRKQEAGGLNSLETAWVVLSLLGNPWIGAIFSKAVLSWLKWLCLEMWRISFQPEWPDNGGWPLEAYLWISPKYAVIREILYTLGFLRR